MRRTPVHEKAFTAYLSPRQARGVLYAGARRHGTLLSDLGDEWPGHAYDDVAGLVGQWKSLAGSAPSSVTTPILARQTANNPPSANTISGVVQFYGSGQNRGNPQPGRPNYYDRDYTAMAQAVLDLQGALAPPTTDPNAGYAVPAMIGTPPPSGQPTLQAIQTAVAIQATQPIGTPLPSPYRTAPAYAPPPSDAVVLPFVGAVPKVAAYGLGLAGLFFGARAIKRRLSAK